MCQDETGARKNMETKILLSEKAAKGWENRLYWATNNYTAYTKKFHTQSKGKNTSNPSTGLSVMDCEAHNDS